MLDRRNDLGDLQLDQISSQIAATFFNNFDLSNIKTIHIYLPIVSKVEVNTWVIINQLKQAFPHIDIVVPKSNFEENTMDNYILVQEDLKVNKWGIPEPTKGEVIDPESIDLIFVPLLAFDEKGYRVGYGKGFYDRFFGSLDTNIIKVGVSSFDESVEISDKDQFDIPLDFCISPNKFWNFKR